ncbi:MAG: hypothetical protein R3C59_03040 [Planctomycetaceae bacterium]
MRLRRNHNRISVSRVCLLVMIQWLATSIVACAQPFPTLTIPFYSEEPATSEPLPVESTVPESISTDSSVFETDQSGVPSPDLVVTVRSDLLSRFVNRQTVESDNVATQVMEANVRGIQTTTTSVLLSTLDSSTSAAFNIVAQGTVASNTVGLTPQARVATLGNHTFNITKPVFFDGQRFTTKAAYGSLQARQFPQSVNSLTSGFPLLGPIGDTIAWNEVQRRMPTTDAIVVRQVADDVLPKVNSGVDRNLAELNRSWQRSRQFLDELTAPDQIVWSAASTVQSFSTSATNASITSRSVRSKQLSTRPSEKESLVLLLTEEGTNRWLDRRSLAGRTVSDTALQQLIRSFREMRENPATLAEVLQQLETESGEPTLFSVRFADVQPLALRFADGLITVRLKLQILPKVGEPSRMQMIQAGLKGQSANDDMWAIALTQVTAEVADRNQTPDMYTNLINNAAVVGQLPPTTLPRTIDLRHLHPKMPLFRLFRIQSDDGQFRLSLRAIETDVEMTTGRYCP